MIVSCSRCGQGRPASHFAFVGIGPVTWLLGHWERSHGRDVAP